MEQEADNSLQPLEQVVEALVFAADAPISASQIASTYQEVVGSDELGEDEVRAAVDQLNQAYRDSNRVLRIEQWGGGYRMATAKTVAPFLKAFFAQDRQQRLSRSLMEAVAIVAYRQPVTKPEVDHVRGVDSGYALRKLMEMGLTDVVGRSDSLGRPLLYGTTDLFLEQFGLNDLDDLPRLREIEELLDDPDFNREKAKMLFEEGVIDEEEAPLSTNGEAPSEE